MARAQLERWALEHPTAPRTGRFFEVPFSYVGPRVAAGIAAAGALWWLNGALFWNYKPESLSPEFVQEVHKIGPVSVRVLAAGSCRSRVCGTPAMYTHSAPHTHK